MLDKRGGNAEELERLVAEARAKQQEEPEPEPKSDSIYDLFKKTKQGVPYASVGNLSIEFDKNPIWRQVIAFDEFRHQILRTGPIPGHLGAINLDGLNPGQSRLWHDTDDTAITAYLNHGDFPTIHENKVRSAIIEFAEHKCRFNPVRNYLDGRVWDGKSRIDNWLITYCHAEPTDEAQRAYIAAVGSKWLISGAARVYEPGCQADHMLVFEGEQGVGKTSAFRILGGEWVSENLPGDLHSKDAADHTRGRWVIELSELGQLGRSAIETIKNFLSRTFERFRPAYGKHEVDYPRQCIFAGTTNRATYLADGTGNRRFWPVKIAVVDLEGLQHDRDQLWAEAVHRYRSGEPWHLTDPAVIATAISEQGYRREVDAWEEPITEYLANRVQVTVYEILTKALCLGTSKQSKSEQNRVAEVLLNLGWQRGKRMNNARAWVKATKGR